MVLAAPRVLDRVRAPFAIASAAFFSCSSPEEVVLQRATKDLACPSSEVTATCRGGSVFHSAEQYRCEAHGCGGAAAYRCEAPLRNVGALDYHLAAMCE